MTGPKKLIALLAAGLLLVGLVATAPAGAGTHGAAAAKKKKKACPAGTQKVVVKKHGKKKKKCVPIPATPTAPAPAAAALTISPTAFTFPDTEHGGFPCDNATCPPETFTVTNTGGAASGVPSVSFVVVHDPEVPAGPAAFATTPATTCTAAVAPGASCTVVVQFAPNSNSGDEMYSDVMHVTASPGGDATSALSGMAM